MSEAIAELPVRQATLPPQAARRTHRDELTIHAADGYPLAATVFRPARTNGAIAVVNSATAVPRQFYRHYANAMAESGFTVVTYDYRGIGGSSPHRLRGFDATMTDWIFKDMAAVLTWANAQWLPRTVIVGHSFGGQTPGLLEQARGVDAMLTLSAQNGHWRVQAPSQRRPVWWHTHVTLPLAARLFGYMPWSWFGSAEDLPKGVAVEWSRWCRNRYYLLDDPGLPVARYRAFAAPVRAYSVADDAWGSATAVDEMMAPYPNVERNHLDPIEHGVGRLGHFGYFRPAAQALWHRDIDWLASVQP